MNHKLWWKEAYCYLLRGATGICTVTVRVGMQVEFAKRKVGDLPVWQFIKFREYITGNQLCSVDVAVVLEQRVSPDETVSRTITGFSCTGMWRPWT